MPTCAKCGSSMEEGFLPDEGDSSRVHLLSWLEGPPERSWWTGLKTKGRRKIPIRALRCRRCGFLELYAREAM